VYRESRYLNGMVCVALATGIAKHALKGRYFDVVQDLEDVLKQEHAVQADPEMYALHTRFLGGLSNLAFPPPSTDEPFDFPGFDDPADGS
jgi:hypothetical protein